MMRTLTLLLVAALYAVPAHGQQMVECRDLGAGGGYLAPNETIINGKACRPAGTPLQAIDPAHPAQAVAAPASAPIPVTSAQVATLPPVTPAPVAPAAVTPTTAPQPAVSGETSGQTQSCLIVRQAEGHRFRNSMIAGALTGGIGFVAGAASGGAKYEYVDSFKLPKTELKYSGKELEKLQGDGVHIVTVSKKASADEIKDARESCRE